MGKTIKSKVFLVKPNSISMRGTIPESIVTALNLSHGDTMFWSIEIVDGKITARVKKAD